MGGENKDDEREEKRERKQRERDAQNEKKLCRMEKEKAVQ